MPLKDPEARRAYARAYSARQQERPEYREYHNRKGREHYASNKDRHRSTTFARKYGITLADRASMIMAQGGLCPICLELLSSTIVNTCVDHDHDTGKVRSILCKACNTGMGQFSDNPELLRKAAEYIEAHRPASVRKAG